MNPIDASKLSRFVDDFSSYVEEVHDLPPAVERGNVEIRPQIEIFEPLSGDSLLQEPIYEIISLDDAPVKYHLNFPAGDVAIMFTYDALVDGWTVTYSPPSDFGFAVTAKTLDQALKMAAKLFKSHYAFLNGDETVCFTGDIDKEFEECFGEEVTDEEDEE